MEKRTKKMVGAGICKGVALLCFWLALALIVLPVMPEKSMPVSSQNGPEATAVSNAIEDQVYPESEKLIPLGKTTGIKMFSEGTMIIGFATLEQAGGKSPAQQAGLEVGDVIVALNDMAVTSNESLQQCLKTLAAPEAQLTIKRKGNELPVSITAVYDREQETWKIGAWVRDSIAGIGTITFVDPENGAFGALGHGISDVDTGQLMEFQDGSVMKSSVAGVIKGKAGEPGELTGSFDLSRNQGVLYANTDKGIFGQITSEEIYSQEEALPIAKKSEIKTGKATIISNVEGEESQEFEIEIVKIYNDGADSSRDMMIRIVDQRLLDITGGIVQGMSGSPIMQNGKLIGAVTHVLVNDPERGYGISIENMLGEAMAS